MPTVIRGILACEGKQADGTYLSAEIIHRLYAESHVPIALWSDGKRVGQAVKTEVVERHGKIMLMADMEMD